MTGPTYKPNWENHKDNPDFEMAVYSERLQLTGDVLSRTDLVTRSGKPVVVESIKGHAEGFVDGIAEQWYVGGITNRHYITLVREADSPHEHDVMEPKQIDG